MAPVGACSGQHFKLHIPLTVTKHIKENIKGGNMRLILLPIIIIFIGFISGYSQENKNNPGFQTLIGLYLGQTPPGMTPEVFAPDIITPTHEVQNCLTISPDGKEIYWGIWYPEKNINKILFSKFVDRNWTKPQFVLTSDENNFSDDAPFLSPDGKKLYFISRRPSYKNDTSSLETVWVAERINMEWSEPKLLPQVINTMKTHMQFSVAGNHNIYFKSRKNQGRNNDIFYSEYLNGNYQAPIKLGNNINSDYQEITPFISKDEKYLIFTRHGIPDGYGGSDLFISFKKADGSWTKSVNLGKSINSPSWENCPIISPDGKYLFFISNRSGRYKIYWVDAKIIKEFKTEALKN
jgi:hypothetical protein